MPSEAPLEASNEVLYLRRALELADQRLELANQRVAHLDEVVEEQGRLIRRLTQEGRAKDRRIVKLEQANKAVHEWDDNLNDADDDDVFAPFVDEGDHFEEPMAIEEPTPPATQDKGKRRAVDSPVAPTPTPTPHPRTRRLSSPFHLPEPVLPAGRAPPATPPTSSATNLASLQGRSLDPIFSQVAPGTSLGRSPGRIFNEV